MNTLTFVICAYKESPYLEECIHSLLAQTVPCTVLLSTSTPNHKIRQAAASLSVPLFVSEHAPSIADDWNSAYQLANTDYVTLAHQDDYYEPEYAETVLACMEDCSRP